jgi:hypothetical protein
MVRCPADGGAATEPINTFYFAAMLSSFGWRALRQHPTRRAISLRRCVDSEGVQVGSGDEQNRAGT